MERDGVDHNKVVGCKRGVRCGADQALDRDDLERAIAAGGAAMTATVHYLPTPRARRALEDLAQIGILAVDVHERDPECSAQCRRWYRREVVTLAEEGIRVPGGDLWQAVCR